MPQSDSDSKRTVYLLRSSPKAMLRLAMSSACTVASLLCIPDGIGIMPDSPSIGVWLIRLFGLWLSAWVLWTLGFSAVLYAVRVAARGIELSPDGMKLWRFGKLIPWSSVAAIASEPQPFFSRAFFLQPPVYKATIYATKSINPKRRSKTAPPVRLKAESIGSMHYSETEFESLLAFMSDHAFELVPNSKQCVLSRSEERLALKNNYEQMQKTRVLISALILTSLVFFLGRKAALNYSFNSGVHEFRQEHYNLAAQNFRNATRVDPTFAPAWDSLARSQFRQGDTVAAERNWRKALAMKPDFVESKIGLANVLAQRGEFDKAEQLLDSALRLSPTNVAAYLNLADVQEREGKHVDAEHTRELIRQLSERSGNDAVFAELKARRASSAEGGNRNGSP